MITRWRKNRAALRADPTGRRWLRATQVIFLATLALVAYAVWPVPVYTYQSDDPVLTSPYEVPVGGNISWYRPGESCFPGVIEVRRMAESEIAGLGIYSTELPHLTFNFPPTCRVDAASTVTLPNSLSLPGVYRLRLETCSNPDKPIRERCVTTFSPYFRIVAK